MTQVKLQWPELLSHRNNYKTKCPQHQNNLQIQYNFYQKSNDITQRNRKYISKIHTEAQKNSSSQRNSEQNTKTLQIILQNHNNKNSMVVAQK
jgi:hypothetical protein